MSCASLLAGKTALITASTSGVGLKTARIMACAGARAVCINGRTEAPGIKAAADIKSIAPDTDVHFVAADLTVPEEVAGLFRIAEEKLGGIDILVHASPLLADNGFAEACHHAVPLMKARGGGAIVALACEAARDPVSHFARALGLEEASIRVNVVTSARAGTETASIQIHHQLLAPAAARARQSDRAPEALAETIAPVIVFLASPLAAHISGQVVSVNRAASFG